MRPKKILTEGKTDDNPIELPWCISRFDFDNLLIYLYMGPSAYPDSEDFLISVMKLSALFEIADGTTYTKAEFNRRGRLIHPALLFELGRCFRIDPWIEQAFRRLMDLPLVSLDFSQAKIQALRTKIAFHVPPLVNSVDCITPDTCVSSWNREWQERTDEPIRAALSASISGNTIIIVT
ncbi:hypothetical protein B0H14DRAFT_3899590 [Mycena olivaceomarginata]|nr:hypothetical protein B0H14DRAFT_3899590 [Mycena olivaceomarginata]